MNQDCLNFRVWSYKVKRYVDISPCLDLHNTISSMYPFDDSQIIEQCTGVKDKNDDLIFQGDIIKQPNGRIFTVVWSGTWLSWALMENIDPKVGSPLPKAICPLNANLLKEWEIIGNIHENLL